ncbi:hypothetical protein LLEC1_04447 [Akanthomyces lecanii]|uniref:Uncharacterized protein n=1 Tax=Cordyceps confragosa TaxID=2714763 RepID=A0A179I1C2_CORDF|nr:hypothetical protein LLEC1_04447 [Akanthomyces lecanii]
MVAATLFMLPAAVQLSAAMLTTPSMSTVVRLGEIAYYMHPLPDEYKLEAAAFNQNPVALPCTVVAVRDSKLDLPQELQSAFDIFAEADDVWSADFARNVIIQAPEDFLAPSQSQNAASQKLGIANLHLIPANLAHRKLPPGPYFVHYGRLYQAYRLYPDSAGAFMVSTVTDDNDIFRPLDVAAYGEQFPSALTVAVPSRLYFTKTEAQPYAGFRLAIKDIIDLKGLKTGASSRAYTDLYPVREETAETVKRLIDLGFVIVGKLKSSQFADSEWPTCDYIDYHGPFNPRGDGYLTPSGSSSGSASAVAAYQWLDFSLGTDTLGSIRSPAAAQSLFAMRPTLGATSTNGLVPYSSKWDTIGGFARSAAEYLVLAQALYGSTETANKTYKARFSGTCPQYYSQLTNGASQEVFETFIVRLEAFLGVKRTDIHLADVWETHRPEGVTESLSEYMHSAFAWSANRDQWLGLLKPFIDEYTEKTGKPPILNPQVRFKVEYTPTVTEEQQVEGDRRIKVYRDWFYKHVMPPAEDGYSSSIMVLPWTTGKPDYRDTYKAGPQQFTGEGFFFYNVGPYGNCPELIFPVGSTPYISKYTGVEEQLPAALGLIGAQGSDMMLADFVSKLFESIDTVITPVEEEAQIEL